MVTFARNLFYERRGFRKLRVSNSGNQFDPNFLIVDDFLDDSEILFVHSRLDSYPVARFRDSLSILSLSFINFGHLTQRQNLNLAKAEVESVYSLKNMIFLESFHVDVVLNIFFTSRGQNFERLPSPGEISTFVENGHSADALHTPLDFKLPKFRVIS